MPSALDEGFLKKHTADLTWTNRTAAVTEEIFITGSIPRVTDFEDTGGDFFLDEPCLEADPIVDDQAVFFDTRDGTVVLLGCGHAGVVNTLNHIQKQTGGRPIHAVLGGMHLINASQDRLTRTMDALRGLDVNVLAPAHCTGARAQARMGTEFPDRWDPSTVGRRFEFPTPMRRGPA
jgi:7,8-dihydropterin-6-yl-methyl-4-(beta-D-ribofuranosyl)aminobenzene 5'-phosphate synthase